MRKETINLRYFKKEGLKAYLLGFLLVLGFVCSSFSGFAQKKSKSIEVDKIIVKVNDKIILKSELDKAYLDMRSRGQSVSRCGLLENMVMNKVMVAKAKIDSVEVEEEEVIMETDRRMQYYVQQIGSEEKIEQFYGKSLEEFKAELFDDIEEQMLVRKMQGEITRKLSVTPAEVKRFYKSIPRDSLPYFSTEVRLGQIVRNPRVSKEQKELSRLKALNLKREIEGGADFGELAKKHSMDYGSGANGGDLGWASRGMMVPQFEATAMRLKKGVISDPVESDFGFHIIELLERRGNQYRSRHILITPQSSLSDVDDAYRYLDSLRSQILEGEITFEKAAREYSDDQETSQNGGYFTDEEGGNRISVEELEPSVFFTLDSMGVGEITNPMAFTKGDGKESVRIMFYKEKVRPHQANLRQDYQKIQMAALNQKREKRLSEWFLEAQREVFIDIDPEFDRCNLLQQQAY